MGIHIARLAVSSRIAIAIVVVALAFAPLAQQAAAARFAATPSLGARGSATIDGRFAPGEWDAAGRVDFNVNVPTFDGGGTTPASLFVMNDDRTLYLGFRVQRSSLAALVNLWFEFDNDHDGTFEPGDDYLPGYAQFSTVSFFDVFKEPCQFGLCAAFDTDDGGTSDVLVAAGNDGTWTTVEIAHGYTQDSAHDISARPLVGLRLSLNLWSIDPEHCNFGAPCAAGTNVTPGSWLDIAITGIDGTAPSVLGSVSPAPNALGWNRSPVEISWSVTDPESAIATSVGCDARSLTAETAGTTITCTATNVVGLSASSSLNVRIDRTAPTLEYVCEAVVVDIAGLVKCALVASDALSGLREVIGEDVEQPAWIIGLGLHTYTAVAYDNADNSSTATAHVTVVVTPESLCALSSRFLDRTGLATSLCAKLSAGAINAYRHEIAAQRGKAISTEQADVLDGLAAALLN